MTAARKPRKPTKAELAARDEAIAAAGGPAPPRASVAGFDGIVGQTGAVEALRSALTRNRLPHAILLHGPHGVGKATCAGALAQALNCATSRFIDACGDCSSCRKVRRGLHPDVLWVEPQKGSIRIGQIARRRGATSDGSTAGGGSRDAQTPHEPIASWVGYRPYEGERRVVVIDDAHLMNPAAQNALLKTLEEPPASSMLLLVTPAPGNLLPTVRSRCQTMRFQPLGLAVMRRHLETTLGFSAEEARLRASLSPGSLGNAINIDIDDHIARRDAAEAAIEDACEGGAALLAAAETLLATGAGTRKVEQASSAIGAVRDILRDLLVLSSGSGAEMIVNLDRAEEWGGWADAFDSDSIVDALRHVQEIDDKLRSPLQPNARLTVEEALIGVGDAMRPAGGR